jgi:hypothetical protein
MRQETLSTFAGSTPTSGLAETPAQNVRWATVAILGSLVAIGLVVKVVGRFEVAIGHDEFHCLQLVHDFERGELAQPFQNFHVQLFGWLSAVSVNEVTQAMAARAVMVVFFLGTCTCLFLLAHRPLGLVGALFSVLSYMSLSYVVASGAEFRPDTPSTFFFMLALYLFVTRKGSLMAGIAAGAAMALSCLFTVKAVFYLGTFALLVLAALRERQGRATALKRLLSFSASFLLTFLVLYRLHAMTFPAAPPSREVQFARSAFSRFLFTRFYPEPGFLTSTLSCDPLAWFLMALGLVACVHRWLTRRDKDTTKEAQLLSFFVPMLSLFFYRNTAGYFYVFIIPAALLLCGYGLGLFQTTMDKMNRRLTPLVVLLLGFFMFRTLLYYPLAIADGPGVVAAQRDLLSEIHKMFPQPVPYIDGCGMVSSYPNAGYFMSSAGMTGQAGRPVLQQALIRKKPLFLLADVPHLDLASPTPPQSYAGLALSEEEWTALRSYFIHHWGPVWVVGKQFDLKSENTRENFEMVVAGTYTVEADRDVLIDGHPFRPGDTTRLQEGRHTIEVGGPAGTIRLRWGEHLYCPTARPHHGSFFMGDLG